MDSSDWSEKSWREHRKYLGIGGVTFVALFFGVGAWAALVPISSAVIAPGTIVIEGNAKTIQHLQGGVVEEIHVRDGDRVEAGDLLLRLDNSNLVTERSILLNRLLHAIAQQARSQAERDLSMRMTMPSIFEDVGRTVEEMAIFESQTRLFEARIETRNGEIEQLSKRAQQLSEEIKGVEELRQSRLSQRTIIAKELKGLRSLYAKGYAKLPRIYALEREEASLLGEISELRARLARLELQIGEANIQILQIDKSFRENALSDLKEITPEVNDLRARKSSVDQRMRQIDIRAPIAGTIHGSMVHTLGGVISPAEILMQIVPDRDNHTVEARVSPQNIDRVSIGQQIRLRLVASTQKNSPDLLGSVTGVSPDRFEDPQTRLPYYRATVDIPGRELQKLENPVLLPGIPVDVYFLRGERTVVEYLAKPLTDHVMKVFREE